MSNNSSVNMSRNPLTWLIVCGILAIIVALVNIVQLTGVSSAVDAAQAKAIVAAVKPQVTVTVLADADCKQCKPVDEVLQQITAKANVTEEKRLGRLDSSGKVLIEQFGIKNLPAVIIQGQIDTLKSAVFKEAGDGLFWEESVAPYSDAATGAIAGLVSVTFLADKSCKECRTMKDLVPALEQSGIVITSQQTIDVADADGKELVEKYNISAVPAAVLSKDLKSYGPQMTQSWQQIGSIETDGSYVTRIASPPYRDLVSGDVKGLVKVTYLADKTCTACYDPVDFHRPILERLGMAFSEELHLDAASVAGKELIKKYTIGAVPTVVLEGDVAEYPILVQAWKQVGSVENGAYIFRNVAIAQQTWKNSTSGEIINVGGQPASNTGTNPEPVAADAGDAV